MSNIVKTDGGSLASLLHGKGGGLTIPKPYERDIFLFDTFIAGTTHIEGIEELAQYLNVNDKLDFYREPHNRFDLLLGGCAQAVHKAAVNQHRTAHGKKRGDDQQHAADKFLRKFHRKTRK